MKTQGRTTSRAERVGLAVLAFVASLTIVAASAPRERVAPVRPLRSEPADLESAAPIVPRPFTLPDFCTHYDAIPRLALRSDEPTEGAARSEEPDRRDAAASLEQGWEEIRQARHSDDDQPRNSRAASLRKRRIASQRS